MTDLLSRVRDMATKSGLRDNEVEALVALAQDAHGLERVSATSMIASKLGVTLDSANQCLLALYGAKFVIEGTEKPPRISVDFNKLGFTKQERDLIVFKRSAFENYGAPHSERAMQTLESFFDKSTGPIILALEVTAPEVFPRLKARATSGKKTVFLMPRKCHVPDIKKLHYDEIKERWIKMFKEADSFVKSNVELRVTDVPFPDLYTSALSQETARFDLNFLDAGTTRDGEILQVAPNTSLYYAIRQRYENAIMRSCPLWRVWWHKAAIYWLRRLIVPIILLVIGFCLVKITRPFAAVGSTVALGLLVNLLTERTRLEKWGRPDLF